MDNKKKILFLYGNEPDPLTVRKIDLLHVSGKFNVYLCFTERSNTRYSYPFQSQLSNDSILRVPIDDPRKGIVIRIRSLMKFFIHTYKLAKQVNPNIIHATAADIFFISCIIKKLLPKVSIIYDNVEIGKFMLSPVIIFLQRILINNASLITYSSPLFKDKYFLAKGIVNEKTSTPFYYLTNCLEGNVVNSFIKKRGGIFTIGYIGAFKGKMIINNLVIAVRNLNRSKGYNIKIFFAGGGLDLPTVLELKDRYDFVEYYGRYIYQKEILSLYERIDVNFGLYDINELWSKNINISWRFTESVSFAIPIIITKGTYMGELVEKNNLGIAIDFDNINELEIAIEKLYLNKDFMKSIENNCKIFRGRYLLDRFKENYITSLISID